MTDEGIRSRPLPNCVLCGREGEMFYEHITDPLYEAPGSWNLKRCPNLDCGLIWLDPMPEIEDIGKAYKSCYYTHSEVVPRRSVFRTIYAAIKNGYLRAGLGYTKGVGPAWYVVLSPLALLHISGVSGVQSDVMYLRADPGAKLLDIGVGDAAMLARFAELGWDVEGIDVDQIAVDAATAKGLNVKLGDLFSQAYPDDSFDCVTMRHVQEHVPQPVELLRECRRILKPGGMLVSVVPNAESWEHRRFKDRWVALEPPRHLWLFGPKSLARLCELSGLEVVRLFSSGQAAWASWVRNMMLRPERFWAGWAPRKLGGLLWHVALRTRMWVDRWSGQEIVLMAQKPIFSSQKGGRAEVPKADGCQ